MILPVLTFQISFNDPWSGSFLWTTIPGTMGVSYRRGAPNEYGRVETGESEVELGDAASALDPNNVNSPYYPNVRRGKNMRAYMDVGGIIYPMFLHNIERLPRLQSVGGVWTQRGLIGVDAFAQFAKAGLKGRSYPVQTSGARWNDVVNDVGVPLARRDIDVGNSTIEAVSFASDDPIKALEHLHAVAEAENGLGFVDGSGQIRFVERHALITERTYVATLADGRSIATGNYPLAAPYVDLRYDSSEVVNTYTGRRATGAVQTASDAASITAYGPADAEITSVVSTDAQVKDAIDWRLARTKDHHERIDSLTLRPGNDLGRWAVALGLEVGEAVRVVEWPPGYPAPVENLFQVRHLAARIPATIQAAEFTFQLTPLDQDDWLILDDAEFGRLDYNKLAY